MKHFLVKIPLVAILMTFSVALAHQGFYQLSKDDLVGDYTISALQDFDIDVGGTSQGQLLLQVSYDGDAVSDETTVDVILKFDGEEIAEDEMEYVGGSSQDGRTFYSSYIYTLPISDLGTYSVNFSIDGEHGQAEQQYLFKSKRINSWRNDLIELIPSAIILIICLVGGALLFLPVRTKEVEKKGEQHV